MKKYDYIFCNYVLEHVYDSIEVLKIMKDLLNEGGSIFIVVPNSPRLIKTDCETDGFVTRIKRSIKE